MKKVEPKNYKFQATIHAWVTPCIAVFKRNEGINVILSVLCFTFGYTFPYKPKDAVPARGMISNTGHSSLVAIEDEHFKRDYVELGNQIKDGDTVYATHMLVKDDWHVKTNTRVVVLEVHRDETLYCQVEILDTKYRFICDQEDVRLFRDDTPVKGYIQDNRYFVTHVLSNVSKGSASPDKVLMN